MNPIRMPRHSGRTRRASRLASLASVILAILFLSSNPATGQEAPETRSVEATGYATIGAGDMAIARDGAVDDALRKAVEQAVGTLVSSETVVENYQVLRDSVYTRTKGYIRDYEVTGEGTLGRMYSVKVRATVALGPLKDDLGAIGLIYGRAEKPRVLFMIAEQNIGQKRLIFWWSWWGGGRTEYTAESYEISAAETALKEAFLAKGFSVVDISASSGAFELSNAYRVADITDDGARSIGRMLDAEIVVVGKAVAEEGPRTPGSPVGSYLANVTAQAVRVDTGEVLASAGGYGTARHISTASGGTGAIAEASADVADNLITQILDKWSAPGAVRVRITGVRDYRALNDFKETLRKRVRGIVAVYQRRYEGDEAVIELDSKVPAQKIADEITRLNLPMVRVKGATHGSIDIMMGHEETDE